MKKFKRFAALVLAGVMALCMLTACSTSVDKQLESTWLDFLNSKRTAAKLTNDPEMSLACAELLRNIESDGRILEEKATKEVVDVTTSTAEFYTVLTSGDPDTDKKVTAVAVTPETFAEALDALSKASGISTTAASGSGSQAGSKIKPDDITATGISSITIGGKTYVALGMRAKVTG